MLRKKLNKKENNNVVKKALIGLVLLVAFAVAFIASKGVIKVNSEEEIDLAGTSEILSEDPITEVTGTLENGEGYIECDSIVQGVRRLDLPDGNYTLRVSGKASTGTEETIDYEIHLYNFKGNQLWEENKIFGDSNDIATANTNAQRMVVVKVFGDLTIEKGVTVTSYGTTYGGPKGMTLYVTGTLTNNGTISMTAKGAKAEGENVYLWKNSDGKYEYVPALGASGAAGGYRAAGGTTNGSQGTNGSNRQTGGGGSGQRNYGTGGSGGAGTSYSGGTGGGGAGYDNKVGGNGSNTGGAGGNGARSRTTASGGTGNPGGSYSSNNGTGGLLIIYTKAMNNFSTIESNGVNGGNTWPYGGASGAGSINIFSDEINLVGQVDANGGISTGKGNGGNGSVTINKIKPNLNYPVKTLELKVNDKYSINKNEFSLIKTEDTVTDLIEVGELNYEILDTSIAEINSDGIIVAKAKGKTKVKITGVSNDISTYIFLEVVDNVKIDAQAGKNFSVALKQNGTVWSYGINNNGQLGIGNNENKTEPIQISNLSNIKSIAIGYSHSLALTENGEIYSWGLGTSGQIGNGAKDNSNKPIKVEGVSNIVKIDAYKNTSIALSNDGIVYIWGEGYSALPMKLIFSEKIVDISGILMLTTKGEVYNITNTSSAISGLYNIAKISSGETHYLALSVNGFVYAWGKNTYGECGTETVGNISIKELDIKGINEISAGNQISILQDENEKVYALGNNTNGQIGLETVTKVTSLTEIILTENINMLNISAGEGTHSSIIDINGFVWNSGINTYGELGIGNTTNQNIFTKIGDTIVNTQTDDMIFLGTNESITIFATLENKFNLKIDLIDDNQENFEISLENNEKLYLEDKTITAKDYGTTTVTVTHIETGKMRKIKVSNVVKLESIVQGLRDINLSDGEYEILIEDMIYKIELYNYIEDMRYSLEEGETSKTISLGNDTADETMLVVKYHKNLIIDEGITLTATTRKKGMYICVLGDIYNSGKISMTARGASAEGENVYLWKNIDNSFEYVPALGASGAAGGYQRAGGTSKGTKGTNGINRQTGGGGSGQRNYGTGGSGGAGTSYSGGSGGGAGGYDNKVGGNGSNSGGAGGDGAPSRTQASGGTGNPGGRYNSNSGTGGLLIIYTNVLTNSDTIESNGVAGGNTWPYGGASGAGSINIFANQLKLAGNLAAIGGKSAGGGSGGDGSVTINELGSVLNYSKKNIEMNIYDIYEIDQSKISYTKLNDIQTEDLSLGELVYESLDSSIAEVDSNGRITAVSEGKTKIKITDTDNGYSTYIIVTVTKEGLVTPQIKEGTDFTVALKANGTVWSYGLNDNGQLGNNLTEDSNEPIQVLTEDLQNLKDIVDIGVGDSSSIAVTKNGEVYTWGVYSYLELAEDEEGNLVETTKTENRVVATKEESLSNIVKVDSYKNNFYAIDGDGIAYIWGEGYQGPTKIETDVAIEDVSGKVLLGEDGRVYLVENPTEALEYLNSIFEISCGEDHYLFVTLEGYVYSLGKGDLGQLGNGTYTAATIPTLVKNAEGYLNNVSSISAGTKTSMAVTYDGKVYVWGDNTNKKLGVTDAKIAYATEITAVYDKEGNEIELKEMEIVETGKNHSSISDKDGYVYSVGLNTNGQLGTEDNTNRVVFTKIGRIEIITNPENINIGVNKEKDVSIALSNSFNLKSDVADDGELELNNTNTKEIFVEKIHGVDNTEVTNIENYAPNYRITGNKIGRVNLIATNVEGYTKNIWINVVSDETKGVAAKVVNGNEFTIALRSDGTVWSFGNNKNGQLGLADTNNRNKPEKIETEEEIVDISSGENHTILLGKSGKVYSFGLNSKGQLGTGNTTTYKVPTVLSIENIEKVSAKENTSFAITKDGTVYSWGEGYTKSPKLLDLTNVIDISKTYYLSDDGIVRRIEDNEKINLSLNEYDPSEEPVLVEERVMQMSEGIDHLILLGESGRVYSYGKNVYGQLGDGTTVARENLITTVVRIEDGSILENIVEISAGDKYALGVSKDGKVYSFGINGEKQLGFDNELEVGGIQESGYAIVKEDISNVERVSAGYTHTAVYKEDGNVYTWGQGEEGQLGNGDNSSYWEAQAVGKNIIETNTNEVLLEEEQTFDIDAWIDYFNLFEEKESKITYELLDENLGLINNETGEVMALESGRTTVIAREEGTEKIAVIPLRILEKGTKPENIEILVEPQVETFGSHTIMLKSNGTVWCYGIGKYGELGTGKEETSDEPKQAIFPEGTIITKIAAGENHSLALDSNGNVWSWGRNNYYQLGNNKDANILVPTKVSGLAEIEDIAAGTYTSFAIGKDGQVYSFGLNANGECGIGSYTNKVTVTKAKYITDAIDIKASKNHTIILKSTGEVYVTGTNLYGELGTESTVRKTNLFTKVEGLDKVIAISAGNSNNTVIKLDGSVYSWGANIYKELGLESSSTSLKVPTKVEGLTDIRYIDGGKGYNLAINSNNEVFVNGLNTSGELGNNSKTNINAYTKLETISDVIGASAGNGYTVMLKEDGTVWACGDYTHGDDSIKSRTKSIVPVQVGNDETGLGETQITIAVDKTKEIAESVAYAFNLISLEDNFTENLNYTSLNEEIATIDESGVITGIRVGTTRVNATSTIDGKVYSILINVVNEENQYAPEVEAGENFAAVLKADGSLWTFGYNADGRLGIGNSLTQDIPAKTNILGTYEDIKAGKDFVLALREDGTVWSVGNNKYGQLGTGGTKSQNKLIQIPGLEKIEKIAAGENFGIAMDSYGIVYGWGNNSNGQLGSNSQGNVITKPTVILTSSQRVTDIAAGKEQSVFVTAKGNIFGYGTILNGTLEEIKNGIKAQITDESIIILTAENKVYEYKNGKVSQIEIASKVIDISATNDVVMYQTADEKTYVSGGNEYGKLGVTTTDSMEEPTLVSVHGENTYSIGAGYNNTYLIENTGNVYAAGYNEYGSIGNGSRENKAEHTLVGNRIFEVEPKTATMNVGDTEEVEITGEPFNVFGETKISSDEYNWETDADEIITVENGIITATAEGTAHITITDKVTSESISLTRIVLEPDSDRIAKITVNEEKAILDETSTQEDMKYVVQVVTNEDKGILNITTNNLTDRISIDEGATWSYNGVLNQEIELTEKVTEVPVIVGVQNNNGEYPVELTYTLTVEKITDEIGINKITVTSKDSEGTEKTIPAKPVNLTRYEVVVEEWTDISLVDVVANSEYSYVSIDGLEYEVEEQTKEINLEGELTKEVNIAIKSEAGTEVEYTLVIYKENELMNLSSLKVNNEEATKVSEGIYAATVSKDTNIANIIATVESSLVQISIENNEYSVKTNTKQLELTSTTTVVTIKVKSDEGIKEYTLYIYKETESDITPKLNMLMVNSSVIEPEEDNLTYIVYLPSAEMEASIRAIAKESTTMVKIAENEEEKADSERIVQIPENENNYKVVLTDEDGKSMEYTVVIRKAEADASIDKIYVSKQDTNIEAELQDDGSYMVKVPNEYEDVDVTAIAAYAKAKVQIANAGKYVVQKDTQNVVLENDETEVIIKVQSEDTTNEKEYTLKIVKLSNDTDLAKVEVDGEEATLGDDGNYHYTLLEAKNNVEVKVEADANNAYVKIENADYVLYEMTKQVDITAKETIIPIKVKAEDGTVKTHNLIIEGLPDDTNIEKVIINGQEATYVEGENRYEIRSEETEFTIDVTLSDILASMVLGNNEKAIGQDSITVEKEESETQVKVTVTSQNGLEEQEYTIAILEKSNNSNLDTLKVNGEIVNPDSEGKYKTTIKNKVEKIAVEAIAEDTYATTSINEEENDSYVANVTESVVDGQVIYNYTTMIVAEDGTSQTYSLEVEQLEANTNITSILVGKEELSLEEATLQEDGTYYYKLDRVEEAYVTVNLESEKSTATINGVEDEIVSVELLEDKNEVIIEVIGEDGTTKEYTLIIEKESNDTTVKSITGEAVLETDIQEEVAYVYVDEDQTSVDLTITLNSEFGSLKLTDEETYEINNITRTIDLSDYETEGNIVTNLSIKAEDDTEKEYTISIYKQPNLDIDSVVVNSDTLTYDEENQRYYKSVSNGNKPQIVITPSNTAQTVQLLDTEGNVLATATGTLTTTQTLQTTDDLITKYVIKVISHNGEEVGMQETDLWIKQKSTETGITYVKVDSLGTTVSSDKLTYSSTVAGKEKYPVEIKLKDENAAVRIEDQEGIILIANQTGVLTGELAVADGETKEFTVVVTSENGEEKEYTLSIERITSNVDIESITVTDIAIDEETGEETDITKDVVVYDESAKIYKVLVNKDLEVSEITIKAISSFTNIVIDSSTGKGEVTLNKELKGLGITQMKIELTAADGTQETRYLQIVQLSDEIGIQTVEVDGIEVPANEAGDYETTVSNENDLSEVKVTLPVETSKVAINMEEDKLQTSTVNVSKGSNRKLVIPIEVTAENEITYTYFLTLNIISHDTSVQEVSVDGEEASFVEDRYIAYFDKNATEANIEVIAGIEYSTITYAETSAKGKLNFVLDTSDLEQEVYETTFKVIAEDGAEKEYTLQCVRKSDDNTIAGVYVNDKQLEANSGNPDYTDGTYYIAVAGDTAKVKVEANNEFAVIKFAGTSATQMLEKTVTLNKNNKITEVPVTITSQQGSTYETVIYIEKVSDSNKLTSVKVNYEEAESTDTENTLISYIYDSVTSAKVEITAESTNANIIRTTEDGETYLDENGASSQGKGSLTIDTPTNEQTTTIYFKIVAESGLETPVYTLNIEKMSTDATLKEIYVEGILIEPNEEGKYVAAVPDTITNPVVKAVTNHELAYVRITLGDEKLNVSEQAVTMSNNRQTIIPITVRSQSGITKVTYLYINKLSTSVELSSLTLNDKEADTYNEYTHTYRFLVENSETDFELFALAESDYTTLEYEGSDYGASLKEVVNMEATAEGKTVILKAKSEAGIDQDYTIEIVHKSDNTDLEYLKVNDVEVKPDEEDGENEDTYTVLIKKLATTATIEVKTDYSYATVRIGDNIIKTGWDKGVLDCSDLTEDRIVVPIVVTAADGTTVKTYNVVLIRCSNDTSVEMKVNDEIVEEGEDGKYKVELTADATKANLVVKAKDEDAQISIDEVLKGNSVEEDIELNENGITTKNMVVVAQDGTTRDITLEIVWLGRITEIVKTQVIEGKDHISTIKVYESNSEENEAGEREILQEIQTNADGSYELDLLPGEYDILIEKDLYLDTEITNIKVTGGRIIELGERQIYAGDVNDDEQIEISDLTAVTYNYGTVEEDNELARYDLNEDGVVNKEDRNIIKGNYNKKKTTIVWIDPEIEVEPEPEPKPDFIIPITTEYKITSPYGTRIHPATGEVSKHTGIDIQGEWHTEILAAAGGEVVFAGDNGAFGNSVEIKHVINGVEIYTFYAHLSRIDVEVGDTVEQGQVIGLEGGDPTRDENPGTSTGHHLHFEVRTASGYGNDVDPTKYIEF